MKIVCVRCKKELDITEFHIDKKRPSGHYPYCKDCRRSYYGVEKLIRREVLGEVDGLKVYTGTPYPVVRIKNKDVRVHRYLAEKMSGRKLRRDEHVHHIDGNKMNWDLSNLVVLTSSEHRSYETTKLNREKGRIKVELQCVTCGAKKEYASTYLAKRGNGEVYECHSCYCKNGGAVGRRKLLKEIIQKYTQHL